MVNGFDQIIIQMVVLFALMAVGFICKKVGFSNNAVDKGLSTLVINVTFPAMAIAAVLNAETLPSMGEIGFTLLFSVITQFLLLALGYALTFAFRIEPGRKGAFRFMFAFGNVGFLGFPVIAAIYGNGALIYAVVFNLVFNVIVYSVGTLMVVSDVDAQAEKITYKTFLTPPIISGVFVIALALLGIKDVPLITPAMTTLGNMTVPATMLVVGSQLANIGFKDACSSARVWLLTLFRLIINPIILFFVLRIFIANPLILGVLVVTAAMSVANAGVMLSLLYGGDTRSMSQGVFVSTVFSMVTIPLLVFAMCQFAL